MKKLFVLISFLFIYSLSAADVYLYLPSKSHTYPPEARSSITGKTTTIDGFTGYKMSSILNTTAGYTFDHIRVQIFRDTSSWHVTIYDTEVDSTGDFHGLLRTGVISDVTTEFQVVELENGLGSFGGSPHDRFPEMGFVIFTMNGAELEEEDDCESCPSGGKCGDTSEADSQDMDSLKKTYKLNHLKQEYMHEAAA